MKRILLTSTALVAFAGAAAAEVAFTGDAKIGYNDDYKNGFYYSAGLFIKASKELSGGLTAGFDLDVDLKAKTGNTTFKQGSITTSDYVLYIKSETAGLYFGDTKTAAETLFDGQLKTAVYGDYLLDNRFWRKSNVDGSNGTMAGGNVDAVARGDFMMGGWKASVSALVYKDTVTMDRDVSAAQAAVSGSFGSFNFGLAVQQEEAKVYNEKGASAPGMVGVYVGGTFGAFDVTLGHVRNTTAKDGSTLLKATYDAGAITVGGFVVAEQPKDNNKYGLEVQYKQGAFDVMAQLMHDENGGGAASFNQFKLDGSYDMGNGLVLKAGGLSQWDGAANLRQAYVAGKYDLGGGASVLLSHAYDNAAGAKDDIGKPEYYEGTTMEVSFKF